MDEEDLKFLFERICAADDETDAIGKASTALWAGMDAVAVTVALQRYLEKTT